MQIKLLGQARAFQNGVWQPIPMDKRGALLVYLAFYGDWLTRDELAFTFWPDTDTSTAKANLRQILRRSKLLPMAEALESNTKRIRWQVETDLQAFQNTVNQSAWIKAVESYGGHLLEQFVIPEAEGFMAWLELERSELQQNWQQAVQAASEALAQTDRHKEAADLIKRVWKLDAFDEEVLRSYMRQAHLAGQKQAALKVYESFKSLLDQDMQLEPLEETIALAKAIEEDGLLVEDSKPKQTLDLRSVTNFVGRDQELKDIKLALNQDEHHQVFAVTGLGGVGKTRLALEVAKAVIPDFEHGVSFVALAGVSAETIIPAIAEALSFSFYGSQDPKEQLLDYLRKKAILLVIDNFEHLTEHADLLLELAAEAPKLKLLVTSREKPDLPNVWTHALKGLSFAEASSPAQTLFLDAIKSQTPNFQANDSDFEAMQELFELVEGLPLGLELSAAWVGELSISEIVQEIKSNLGFLDRDGKRHHDSLKAVLEHSWDLLSPEQQKTLAKLSVFRGGFSREAAQEVTGASNYLILSLLNRSLVRKQENRYDLHEMVWQYARDKLQQLDTFKQTHAQHSRYFAQFVAQQKESLKYTKQLQAIQVLNSEKRNATAAWSWAAEQQENASLELMLPSLSLYYSIRSYLQEAEKSFSLAVNQLADDASLSLRQQLTIHQAVFLDKQGKSKEAEALILALPVSDDTGVLALYHQVLGSIYMHLNTFADASTHLQTSLKLYQSLNNSYNEAILLDHLGNLDYQQGNYQQAETYYQKAWQAKTESGDRWGLAYTLGNLGVVADHLGRYEEASNYHTESLSIKGEMGDLDGQGSSLLNLGTLAYIQGNLDEAKSKFQQSLKCFQETGNRARAAAAMNNLSGVSFAKGDLGEAEQNLEAMLELRHELGDQNGVAKSLYNLGLVAKKQDNLQKAKQRHQQSLEIYRSIGNQAGIITALSGIGYACIDLEENEEAWLALKEAFELAMSIGASPRALDVLRGIALFLDKAGQKARAYHYAKLVAEHAATIDSTRDSAKNLQEEIAERLKDHPSVEEPLSLEQVVTELADV